MTPDSQTTDLTGASPATICSAPDAGVKRWVMWVRAYNRDTAVVTITLQLNTSGTRREIEKRVGIAAAGGIWDPITRVFILDDTQTLEMVMSGGPATTEPVAHVQFVDV